MNEVYYEIQEIKYNPNKKSILDFKGNLDETKAKAEELAKANVGTRYAVFRSDSCIAEYQTFYRTTVACPSCGEKIPIE